MRTLITIAMTFVAALAVVPAHGATPQITIFSGIGHGFAPVFVADRNGYFKDEGLDVRVVTFTSGSAALEAFRAGRAQFVATGDLPALRTWEIGAAVGLAPLETDDERMVIVADRAISTPGDFKGRKVATRLGSTGDYLLRKYLQHNGLRFTDVTVVNLAPPDMVLALARGDVDAFVIWQPYGWQAEEVTGGKARVLTTGKGLIREYLVLSGSPEFVRANRETTAKVLKALHRAAEWLESTPLEETAKLVADYTKSDLKLTAALLKVLDFSVAATPEFRREMESLAEFGRAQGALEKPIDWGAYFDPSFLKAVSPDLAPGW